MKHTFDVIVAGLGAMGSAALYQLAKRGIKAIGIDQFTPPHTFGSSHGETRIVRQATGQAVEYTPLAQRAYEIWKELGKINNQNLMTITGGIIVEAENNLLANEQQTYLSVVEEAAAKYNIEHEILSNLDLTKRFPQFHFPYGEKGYYEPNAGFLRPELCIEVQLSLARKMGSSTNFNERILECITRGEGVSVKTDKDEYSAKSLIATIGPWVPTFFPQYKQYFKICRQVLYWFDIKGDATPYLHGNCPVFIFEQPDGSAFYGFPGVDGPKGGLKLAGENYTTCTTPEYMERNVTPEETQGFYEKFVHTYIPGLTNHCIRAATCLYTLTPDYHFILDVLPEAPQIVLASPCSGHGFKYSAAIGETLAELAINKKTTINIDKFRLSRFAD